MESRDAWVVMYSLLASKNALSSEPNEASPLSRHIIIGVPSTEPKVSRFIVDEKHMFGAQSVLDGAMAGTAILRFMKSTVTSLAVASTRYLPLY